MANATMSRDEAEAKSERDRAAILPDGFATYSHSFYIVEDAVRGAPLGRLWLVATGTAMEADGTYESPRYMELLVPHHYVHHILRMPYDSGRTP